MEMLSTFFPVTSFDRLLTGNFYGLLHPPQRPAFFKAARRVAPELVIVELAEGLGGGRVLFAGNWFVI